MRYTIGNGATFLFLFRRLSRPKTRSLSCRSRCTVLPCTAVHPHIPSCSCRSGRRAAGGGRRSWPRLRWFRLATLVPWQIGNDQLWLLVCVCPCKRVHVYMHMRCDGCRLCVRFRFSATVVEDPWEGQPLPEGCSVPEKPLVSSRRKKVDCAVQ